VHLLELPGGAVGVPLDEERCLAGAMVVCRAGVRTRPGAAATIVAVVLVAHAAVSDHRQMPRVS
jgi:hypothetical protein